MPAQRPPFVVLGLPRSRTCWLASFLSYAGTRCDHEPSARWKSLIDMAHYLDRPLCGASDTMLALRWEDVVRFRPDTHILVVRRDPMQVIESIQRQGYWCDGTAKMLAALTRKLDLIEGWSNAQTVRYEDLATERGCEIVFRHCLGLELNPEWFDAWADTKVEADLAKAVEIVKSNRSGILALYGRTLEG